MDGVTLVGFTGCDDCVPLINLAGGTLVNGGCELLFDMADGIVVCKPLIGLVVLCVLLVVFGTDPEAM